MFNPGLVAISVDLFLFFSDGEGKLDVTANTFDNVKKIW